MSQNLRSVLPASLLLFGCATQEAAPPSDTTNASVANSALVTDLASDFASVETKMVDLAMAIPEEKYGWQPEGARTVRQVLLHVAADNYILPAMLGFMPDPSSGISGADYAQGAAFEARNLSRDSVVAELKRSFAFAKQSLASVSATSLTAPVTMFGQQFTGQSGWILTVTHVHEHLGQLIAYARTNGVKPPWS